MAMKLSTGKVAFPIEFDNGDKDCIYFNPNDPDIALRMKSFQENIYNKIEKMDDIQLKEDGTPVDDSAFLLFKQFRQIVFDELDAVFSSKVSNVVFKHCSPFAIVGGKYFVLQFMEAAMPEIEKHIEEANKDLKNKIEKHIGKYVQQ